MTVPTPAPRRILVVRVDRLGDLLTTTPALRSLRAGYPDAQIDLLASDGNYRAVADNPRLDRVFVLHRKRYWQWPLLALRLRRRRYDWVIDVTGGASGTAGFFVVVSGAERRISYPKQKRAWCFNTTFAPTGDHAVRNPLGLARCLGGADDDEGMEFVVPEAVRTATRARYPRVPGRGRVAVFIGNAKKLHSRWPIDKFDALVAGLLEDPAVEVGVLAGPADLELARVFDGRWSERLQLIAGDGLAADAAYLETADLLLTSSSGPMHLAAAVGTPTLSLLAGYTHGYWRPLGSEHRAVLSDDPGVDVRSIPVEAVRRALDAMRGELAGDRPRDPRSSSSGTERPI